MKLRVIIVYMLQGFKSWECDIEEQLRLDAAPLLLEGVLFVLAIAVHFVLLVGNVTVLHEVGVEPKVIEDALISLKERDVSSILMKFSIECPKSNQTSSSSARIAIFESPFIAKELPVKVVV